MVVDTFVVELLDDVVTAEQDFVDAVMRWVPLFCWDVAALYIRNTLRHLVIDLKVFHKQMEINNLFVMIVKPSDMHLGPMLLHMKVHSHRDMLQVEAFVSETLKHSNLMEIQLHIDIQWDEIDDIDRHLMMKVSFPKIIPLMQPQSTRPHSAHWYRWHRDENGPFSNGYVMQGHNTYIMCTSKEYTEDVYLRIYTKSIEIQIHPNSPPSKSAKYTEYTAIVHTKPIEFAKYTAIVPNIFAGAMQKSGWMQKDLVRFPEKNKLNPMYVPPR